MSSRKLFGKPLLAQLQPHRLRASSADRSNSTSAFGEASFAGSTNSLNSTILGCNNSRYSEAVLNDQDQLLLGYNQYVRALLEEQIVARAHQTKRNQCNDQLHIFKRQLGEVQLKEMELKANIHLNAQQDLLLFVMEELQLGNASVSTVFDESVMQQVALLEGLLQGPANMLFLKNVAFANDQDSYNRLENLFDNCISYIAQILMNAGDVDGLTRFVATIDRLNEKLSSVEMNWHQLHKINENVYRLTLKTISDLFANN